MKKNIYFIFAILVFLTACDNGAEPEIKSLDETALNRAADSFYWSRNGVLGIMHQLDIEGYESWKYAKGDFDLSGNRQLQWNDPFSIGSISKTYSATVVLQLMEENQFELSDPIINYLPGKIKEKFEKIPYSGQITIYQALCHKSGIFSYTNVWDFLVDVYNNPERARTTEEMLDYVIDYGEPYFEPGTGFKYSNTNYILLGEMIEQVTGKPLSQVLRERIFDRLDLSNTYLEENLLSNSTYDVIHGYDDEFGRKYDLHEFNFSGWGGAAGGIISTTEELNIFFKALVDGELFTDIETFQIMLDDKDEAWYGLGIFVKEHPKAGLYYGHGGGQLGMSSIAFYFVNRDAMISTCISYDGTEEYIDPEEELNVLVDASPELIGQKLQK